MSAPAQGPSCRPPASDTIELYVQMPVRDIHFLETIMAGYDGIAHVRRDWHLRHGKRWIKVLVAPDLKAEARQALAHAGRYVPIEGIRTEP